MLKIQEVKNKNIIIDSNILIHYAEKGFKERSGNPLRILLDNGNRLAVTPVTGFELLRGYNKNETQEKYLSFLNFLPYLEIEKSCFQNAAILDQSYRKFCNNKKVPAEDLIIGGTLAAYSFTNDKPLLFTTDRNDFCEPIWNTIASCVIPPVNNNEYVVMYLLELNADLLDIK